MRVELSIPGARRLDLAPRPSATRPGMARSGSDLVAVDEAAAAESGAEKLNTNLYIEWICG